MFGLFKKKAPAQPAGLHLTRDQLVPRIKHHAFVLTLERAGVPKDQQPAITPLCGELLVTYAFDLPGSFIMASPSMLRDAGIMSGEVAQLALANLRRQLPEPQFFRRDDCGVAQVGDDLEATLLLVDSVWSAIAPTMQGELLAVVPRRNRLVLCDSANQEAMGALRELADDYFDEEDDQHRLSKQVMVRRGGCWTLYQPG